MEALRAVQSNARTFQPIVIQTKKSWWRPYVAAS